MIEIASKDFPPAGDFSLAAKEQKHRTVINSRDTNRMHNFRLGPTYVDPSHI
jgi:hypothetical protein